MELTLNKLKVKGLKCNIEKSFFGQTKMEYLGFGVTCNDVKHIDKKIKYITNMNSPTYRKEVRQFIGVINYYHNIWSRLSHTLAPLTKLTSMKINFKWTEIKKDAFDEIKRIMARDTLLTYPYFNETFKIYTDSSAFQLGAVVIQKGKLIALYSIQLTYSQQQYTITKSKLLSIVETTKALRTILLCQKLRIYTDHKNLTCETS